MSIILNSPCSLINSTVVDILRKKGAILESCVNTITSDNETWFKFIQKSELGLNEPENLILREILIFFFVRYSGNHSIILVFFTLGYNLFSDFLVILRQIYKL